VTNKDIKTAKVNNFPRQKSFYIWALRQRRLWQTIMPLFAFLFMGLICSVEAHASSIEEEQVHEMEYQQTHPAPRIVHGGHRAHRPLFLIRYQLNEIYFTDNIARALVFSGLTSAANSQPVSDAAKILISYKDIVERNMNPARLYLDRHLYLSEEQFHSENWKKYFIEFIEGRPASISINYRFWSTTLEEYIRRWEGQKILARRGLPWRILTDEDVLREEDFYTEKTRTIYRFLRRSNGARGNIINYESALSRWATQGRRHVEELLRRKREAYEYMQRYREQARNMIFQYWGIPENTPACEWSNYIDYREQILTKERVDALYEPNHVANLFYISFLLNDEGMIGDAWRHCITALTRNYQKISKALDRAIAMLEGSILRWEKQCVLTSRDQYLNMPTTKIGQIMHRMNLRVSPGGIIRF